MDADDIKAIRDALDAKIAIKAVGNIRDVETAQALIDAGARASGQRIRVVGQELKRRAPPPPALTCLRALVTLCDDESCSFAA